MSVTSINLTRGIRQQRKRLGMKVVILDGNGFDRLFRQHERQLVHRCSYTEGSQPLCWGLFSLSSAVWRGRNDRTADRFNRDSAGSTVLSLECPIP